jgi:RNA polymerase sigma-70 factor, ECF subfamily
MKDDLSKVSDNELYQMLFLERKKRELAFAEIYSRYSVQVYRYCRRLLNNKDLSDDVFQDTFHRLLKSSTPDKYITNMFAYLLKIARNVCYSHNKHKDYKNISIEDVDVLYEENFSEGKELQSMVTTALDLLSKEYREAFVLQVYNDLSYNEISSVLEVPVSTVRNRIVRAKRKIRQILAPYFEENEK